MSDAYNQCLIEAERLRVFDPAHPLLRFLCNPNDSALQQEFIECFGSKESDPSDSSVLQIVKRIEKAYQHYSIELRQATSHLVQTT